MSGLAILSVVLVVIPAGSLVSQPEVIVLWPDGAPGAVGTDDQDVPELRVYAAERGAASGTGVVICPGGGYGILASDHEGAQVARWFNSIGVSAFVLKYRLAPRYRHPA